MTDSTESGFILDYIVYPAQSCHGGVPPEQVDTSRPYGWGWDWRWLDASRFEVAIALRIPPTAARPEVVEVTVAGGFRLAGTPQTVSIDPFVHVHAPAILFPYARQAIDDMTSRGVYGRLLLPPINVSHLMSTIDRTAATGARQLRPTSG